jgi:hypothetical protein
MFDVIRRRLTYANTMATIAVLIALGGTSYAAAKLTGRDVKDGSLTGADVRNSSLNSRDIADRSLRAIDFRRRALRPGREGEPGENGFDGFDGFDGEPGPPGITLAAGRVEGVADQDSAAVTFYGSPTGVRAADEDEQDVEILAPAFPTTARDLSIALTRSPCDDDLTPNACGDPGSATVTLRVAGADTPVTCTITTPGTACDSGGASADVPAGARLSLKVAGDLEGNAGNQQLDRDALFGLALQPAD